MENMVITQRISAFLKDSSDKQKALDTIIEMLSHYKKNYEEITQMADVSSAVYSLQSEASKEIEQSFSKHQEKVSCGKGCSFCCHIHVDITLSEAVNMVYIAHQNNIPIDWALVEKQAKHDLPKWKQLQYSDRKCVFLGADGMCQNYEYRPLACWLHNSVNPSENCDTEQGQDHIVGTIYSIPAEVIVSVICSKSEHGSMPDMLLKAREILYADLASNWEPMH